MTDMESVYCAVRTAYPCIIQNKFRLEKGKATFPRLVYLTKAPVIVNCAKKTKCIIVALLTGRHI